MLPTPKVRNDQILIQELEKELLIYDLKTDKALSLNETCAMVWRECDGNRTIPEIASILNRETDSLINEEVVWLALDTLRNENLLEESFEMNSKFKGMNRREAIRKVGFASMVAIPFITSLIAPTAANAQSSCINPGGQPPTTPFTSIGAGATCVGDPCIVQCNVNSGFCCSDTTNWVSCATDGAQITCQCECL